MSNNIDVFNNNKNYITHTISYCLGRGSWKCVKCHLGGSGLISALPVLAFSIIPNLHT